MGYDEQTPKRERRLGDQWAKFCALGYAAIFLVVTWAAVLHNINKTGGMGWFAFHPPLQSLALFLFTYGILTLQPTSQPKTKAAGLARHQLAMIVFAFPLILLGTFAIVFNKWSHGHSHLTTWHGILGTVSVVWLFFQVLVGGGSVWFDGAAFGGGAKAKAVWKYHRLSGYILFPLLFYTAHLGGSWSSWMIKNSTYAIRAIAYAISPLVVVVTLYSRTRLSKLKFF